MGPLIDRAESIVQTADGGYALAGCTFTTVTTPSYDFALIKTDSLGWLQWNKTYGGTGADFGQSMVQTADGGYVIAGESYSFGADPDMWLIKTDTDGNMVWDKRSGMMGDDYAHSVIQTSDGGYAVAGYTNTWSVTNHDFFLFKLNSLGITQWVRTYGGPGDDYAYSVVQTSDGGYAVAGKTYSFGDDADMWLIRTDPDGIELWNQTYGGTSDEAAYSLVQTVEGGYALAGYTRSYSVDYMDCWLVKTDSAGNMQWSKTYGGTYAMSVIQTSDSGYAFAGTTPQPVPPDYTPPRFYLVKTEVESGLAWTDSTNNAITLYRGRTDAYWNFVRVRIWTVKEPTWQYGDIDMDGDVDYDDFIILAGNYGKTYSALSLGGIVAIAGIYTYKKRKQPK